MARECEICRGRKLVRLPIFRMVTAIAGPDDNAVMQESSRDYPCPECSDVLTVGQVGALREETFVASYIKEPAFIDHIKYTLANQIAGRLLKDGYIRFERAPEDAASMRFAMRATIAIANPSKLDTLEARVAERQTEVAKEVVGEAEHQINNWGSHYGHADILKQDATRFVREAINAVLKRRASWRPS